MPHLFGLALIGAALYGAYRLIRREMRRIGDELDHRPKAEGGGDGTRLVRDPETGIYRPEERG